jgi:uncharacterized membrane protein
VKASFTERLSRALDRLLSGFWFVPGLFVVSSVVLAIALIALDRSLQDDLTRTWIYGGGPDNASETLSTIASSMITFTALVFSITMVALQLTSSQFSPRVMRNVLRDRRAQVALGVFVSTFAYAFTALSAVRLPVDDDSGFVPTVTVTGALVLLAASVVAFVDLLHHMSQSLRVTTIIDRVGRETRDAIDRLHPTDAVQAPGVPPTGAPVASIAAPEAGAITDVDIGRLARCAAEHDLIAVVPHPVGTFVCSGMPLIDLHAGGPEPRVGEDEEWTANVQLDGERTMRQDVQFGFRQLVDVAERALSPGVTDPTTAIQCLDRIHELLRQLAGRAMPLWRTARRDDDSEPRAYVAAVGFPETIDLALDEIRHWGSDSPRVHRRLVDLLDDLETVTTSPVSRMALARQRDLLAARRDDLPTTEYGVATETDRDAAARVRDAARAAATGS